MIQGEREWGFCLYSISIFPLDFSKYLNQAPLLVVISCRLPSKADDAGRLRLPRRL